MIEIPGRFHSKATDHVVAGANEILDDELQKKQSVVNAENESFKDAQTELNEAQSEFNSEVREALGTGGTVDERIANAVNTEKDRAEGAEEALDGRVETLEEAVGDGGSVDERIADEGARHYTKDETYNKTELNNLITTPNQSYVTVDAYASLPATGSADTIYRVSNYDGSTSQVDATKYSEYAWDGTQYVFLCVKSQIGEVFDISAYHATGGTLAKYADLAAALNGGANIPQSLQKGGMSVKFVQSSDNKYAQWRFLLSTFTSAQFTNISNWQNEDIDKALSQFPYRKNTFTINAGVEHSSTLDKTYININTGETFSVSVKWQGTGTIIAWYADGTSGTLSNSLSYVGEASKNIIAISFYTVNRTEVPQVCEITVLGQYEYELYENLKTVENINGSVYRTVKEKLNYLFNDSGVPTSVSAIDASEIMSVDTGTKILFTSELPSGYHALLFYDSDCNVIETYGTGKVVNGLYEVSNSLIKYVRFQSRNASGAQLGTVYDLKIYDPEIGTKKKIRIYKRNINIFDIYVPGENGSYVLYEWDKYYKKWDTLTYIDSEGNTQTATNIVSSNFWNNLHVINPQNNTLLAQGNSNFICKVTGEPYYIGDGHGNEALTSFTVLADGKEIDIDNLAMRNSILCDELRIISKSNMYECDSYSSGEHLGAKPKLDTSGNPVVDFIHMMEIHYTIGNTVTINNKLMVKKNNLSFVECFGAMLDCYYGKFDTVICDNEESTMNHIANDGTCSVITGSTINLRTNNKQYAHSVKMYGNGLYISQSMINDKPQDISKSGIAFEFYSGDLKCYFTPVKTTRRYPDTSEPDVFNTGDVIAVTDVRKIELNA